MPLIFQITSVEEMYELLGLVEVPTDNGAAIVVEASDNPYEDIEIPVLTEEIQEGACVVPEGYEPGGRLNPYGRYPIPQGCKAVVGMPLDLKVVKATKGPFAVVENCNDILDVLH